MRRRPGLFRSKRQSIAVASIWLFTFAIFWGLMIWVLDLLSWI